MSVLSFNLLNAAVHSRLTGGTALTAILAGGTASPSVYFAQAPDDAVLPYVVFSWQSGPIETNDSPHRNPNGLLYVRGYAAHPAQAGTIDAQIDTLLHMSPLTVSGYTNFWIARETPVSDFEIDDAQVKTWNAGALYRTRFSN